MKCSCGKCHCLICGNPMAQGWSSPERVKILTDALKFYAGAEYVDVRDRYIKGTPDVDPHIEVLEDDGTIARKALAEFNRKGGAE